MKRLALLMAIAVGSISASAGLAQAGHYGWSGGGGGSLHGAGYGGYNQYPQTYGRSSYGSGYGGHGQSWSGGSSYAPQYHAPSLHYDRVYHQDYLHWTPSQGLHSHGHYDTVPHFTPGHFHY